MLGRAEIDKRFDYHAPAGDKVKRHADVRMGVKTLAEFLDDALPDSREKSTAMTHLEDALMWANAAIARNEL